MKVKYFFKKKKTPIFYFYFDSCASLSLDILIENIYTQAKKSPEIWSLVISPSFNQLIKPILHYIKHTVLMTTSINQASKELARILFSQLESTQIYLEEFLNTALLKLSKSSWADDTLARFAICTLIHVQGLDSSGLSSASTEWIIKYAKRLIETWSDPTFIKHASSRERNCKDFFKKQNTS